MCKLFLDTNFLIDTIGKNLERFKPASVLGGILQTNEFQGAISPHSLSDFSYINRHIPREQLNENIHTFLEYYHVVPLTSQLCTRALLLDEPDYEDSIIRACAEDWEADYIISADRNAYKDSLIPRIEAADFLKELGITA